MKEQNERAKGKSKRKEQKERAKGKSKRKEQKERAKLKEQKEGANLQLLFCEKTQNC
jgi:hypothetical protein